MPKVWTRRLLKLGIVIPIFLNVVATLDALTRPEFDYLRHWVSHQSLGERGWLGTLNFLHSGLFICVFAIALKQTLRAGKGSLWGPILVGTYGTGLLLAAFFPIDPGLGWPPEVPAGRSASGSVHDLEGAMVFGALTAVCFVMSRRFKNDPQWSGWRMYSIVSGVGVLIAFILCSIFVAMDYSNVLPGAPSGLFERISLVVGNLWIVLFTIRLLQIEHEMGVKKI